MIRRQFLVAALMATFVLIANRSDGNPPMRIEDEQERAGFPQEISRFARPSTNAGHVGYYVGGGAAWWRRSEPPTPIEGTWGLDYQGRLFPRRVILNWWHGRRYQGGTGAYKTDGPKLPERD